MQEKCEKKTRCKEKTSASRLEREKKASNCDYATKHTHTSDSCLQQHFLRRSRYQVQDNSDQNELNHHCNITDEHASARARAQAQKPNAQMCSSTMLFHTL